MRYFFRFLVLAGVCLYSLLNEYGADSGAMPREILGCEDMV